MSGRSAKRKRGQSPPHSGDVARREDLEQLERQVVQIRAQQASFYSGPLPQSQELRAYEQICSGAADRIISMAEGNAEHRRSMESRNQIQGGRRELLGMVLGFILGGGTIAGGIYLIKIGAGAEGLTAILVPLAGLVGTFVYARKTKLQELARKWNQMLGPPGE